MYTSDFDGGLLEYVAIIIGGAIISVLTLGIATPWVMCVIYRWKIDHTVIEGRRLRFHGTGSSLFGQYIKWILLIIITLGIYSFWVGIKLEQWKVRHTTFVN
ncbi:DUF898 family protein [Fundicoccus culcitae]|uniref:YjgN family protein n=1 Tax=Fundicoccus culcitae TaxID=2969821 RepID=A0ABY5P2B1_9LACT|nr:DUF898 family protein [Fundicoccus culcitae]UUX32779.1 YjgN family protein [Fundicoccus culcitae]